MIENSEYKNTASEVTGFKKMHLALNSKFSHPEKCSPNFLLSIMLPNQPLMLQDKMSKKAPMVIIYAIILI